ncbi:hypothetical protein SAMN05421682_10925 [Chryseobacterium indoltheticum]|jgi:hypothetical protein|uniref:Uncharacterized protein n=1 Tax=Chryseobacterium indoltheticum TaxID=254 RepID=A0A381F6B0_9FLAO|nr:hypothetical protein EG358_01545 [Chryseobacterium indoltheticum]MDF2833115.1 hypothetical protein [Chryseobacterium indoltheticum]SIQ82965.1 hypothetical protein SAMN05421682_10925 [Chryseobacterium indoltheticum]SUX42096.1 Uncharacterised protein [Chryseobacterium indoltheticum]
MANFNFETVVQILTDISLSYQLIEKGVKSIVKIIRMIKKTKVKTCKTFFLIQLSVKICRKR